MNAESVHTCSWPVQALRRVSGPGDAQLCQAPFSPSAWGDTGLPVWLRTPSQRGQDWDAETRPQKQKSDHKVCRCFYPTGGNGHEDAPTAHEEKRAGGKTSRGLVSPAVHRRRRLQNKEPPGKVVEKKKSFFSAQSQFVVSE